MPHTPGWLRTTKGVRVAFRTSGDSEKGNSDGDSPAGHVRVLRGADVRRGRHRRVAETRPSTSVRTIHVHSAEKSTTKSSRWLHEGILSVFIY